MIKVIGPYRNQKVSIYLPESLHAQAGTAMKKGTLGTKGRHGGRQALVPKVPFMLSVDSRALSAEGERRALVPKVPFMLGVGDGASGSLQGALLTGACRRDAVLDCSSGADRTTR